MSTPPKSPKPKRKRLMMMAAAVFILAVVAIVFVSFSNASTKFVPMAYADSYGGPDGLSRQVAIDAEGNAALVVWADGKSTTCNTVLTVDQQGGLKDGLTKVAFEAPGAKPDKSPEYVTYRVFYGEKQATFNSSEATPEQIALADALFEPAAQGCEAASSK